MRTRLFVWYIALFWAVSSVFSQAPVDAPETLRWVKKQGQHIEQSLHDALRSNDQAFMVLQMHRAWREFDAVAQAGLYCHAARTAAERGRAVSDLLRLDYKKDWSNLAIRATEAREQAFRMQAAAEACAAEILSGASVEKRYLPSDLLLRDALIAELDLSDAKASGDFHILAQKVEHALRMLRDAEYLASTLENCVEARIACQRAIDACRDALTTNHWDTAIKHLRRGIEQIQIVRNRAEDCG
ncbi:MAG: hypothetical protein RMJ33_12490 [Saprospiraceae bacterium]|nr:hypothetical protein [Saprospiraceae bacterium]MDW8230646.1 hypothetical protein [Saprospiraceae bacterium]